MFLEMLNLRRALLWEHHKAPLFFKCSWSCQSVRRQQGTVLPHSDVQPVVLLVSDEMILDFYLALSPFTHEFPSSITRGFSQNICVCDHTPLNDRPVIPSS